ncbi:LysM-like peptidoglycan-binding domain-containing protein [Zobellella aerophila]|uniref:Opacity-associated protein A LysM-like domain-containing protein n=1 Tax=Zobellella aerophila TaxID=870480 RepID=A0ABP6VKL2_9GAMM
MTRRKSDTGRRSDSFGTTLNELTLPARQGLGRGLDALARLPKGHRTGILLLLPLWLLLLLWQPAPAVPPVPVSGALSVPLGTDHSDTLPIPEGGERLDHRVAQGETLSSLFRTLQLPGTDVIALVRAEPSYKPISNLRAGQNLILILNGQGQLHYLEIREQGLTISAFRRLGQEFALVNTP